jgi:CRP-like cAMP-binding protein
MSYAIQTAGQNQLLASLPAEDAAFLQAIGRTERLRQGKILTSRFLPANDVWFPHSGLIAFTATDIEGRRVQTGVVGSEGCVGVEALFDGMPMLPDAIVQVEATVSVIAAAELRFARDARPQIHSALAGFLYGLCAQSLQTIACNRLHTLDARCCRWLLSIQDRLAGDELPLTQESLATLLGSGRPRINGVLARLEQDGLLHRRRGRIRLLTRPGLQARSCDCYAPPAAPALVTQPCRVTSAEREIPLSPG